MDLILQTWLANYAQKKFEDDKRDAKGLVDPNQKPRPGVVRPSNIRAMVVQILRQQERDAVLQEVDASVAGLLTQKSSVNAGRCEVAVDLHAVDHLHQLTVLGKEVSAG
jgi:phage tail sheath gpL-like